MEHSSVLEAARQLEGEGRRISRIRPDVEGCVSPGSILGEVGADTRLISLIHSSNEVGTLQPVAELARTVRSRDILLHADAVQSAGKVPLDVTALGVDLLSLSAHKMGGPAGVGCLWVREGVSLEALLRGGGQESNRRAGTEAVALIAGFGAAAELALSELASEPARIGGLRDRLEENLERSVPDLRFHGRGEPRLPNTVSVAVRGCQGEEMVMALDLDGIAVSTGSACAAGTVRPSHVLEAMGCSREEARSTLRISLGHGTTREDLLHLEEALPRIVSRIRLGATGAPVAPGRANGTGA
jgi:cysteine desulfurase